MAITTFSGPVVSNTGFTPPVVTSLSDLPAVASVPVGTIYVANISGTFSFRVNTGSAWHTVALAAP